MSASTSSDYPKSETPTAAREAQTPTTTVKIPGGHGAAFRLRRGTHFRVVSISGQQVVDMLAWAAVAPAVPSRPPRHCLDDDAERLLAMPAEHLSMSHTRHRHCGVIPEAGECLYTNAGRPLCRVVADVAKTHDMTFMCCYPAMYERYGLSGHRSCAANVAEAVTRLHRRSGGSAFGVADSGDMSEGGFFGDDRSGMLDETDRWSWMASTDEATGGEENGGSRMSHLQIPDPFNIFQNTPYYTMKGLGCSRPGDYMEFEVLEDAILALSCCPFDLNGFNGGESTDVLVDLYSGTDA